MNDRLDTELAALRDSLHAEARRGAPSAAALADVKAGGNTVAPRPRQRPLWLAGAAVLATAAAVVGLMVLSNDDRDAVTVPVTEPTTESTSTETTAVPDTTASSTTAAPTTVAPHTLVPVTDVGAVMSISYGSATDGWAIVETGAEKGLIRTVPSGWVLADPPGPADTLSVVRFADERNGWLIGADRWWSTHDGGGTWNELPTGDTPDAPLDVAVAGGWVMTLRVEEVPTQGFSVRVWRSPVGQDDFRPTDAVWPKGAGGNDVVLTAASDGADVLVAENDRGGRTLRLHPDGTVSAWTTPAEGRGGDIVVSSPAAGGPVWVQSQTGVWGGDAMPQQVLAVAATGGEPFVDVHPPEPIMLEDVGARLCGLSPVDSTTAIAVMCDAQGARMYRTGDLGVTWERLAEATADPGVEWSWSSSMSPSGVIALVLHLTSLDSNGTDEVWIVPTDGTAWIAVLT